MHTGILFARLTLIGIDRNQEGECNPFTIVESINGRSVFGVSRILYIVRNRGHIFTNQLSSLACVTDIYYCNNYSCMNFIGNKEFLLTCFLFFHTLLSFIIVIISIFQSLTKRHLNFLKMFIASRACFQSIINLYLNIYVRIKLPSFLLHRHFFSYCPFLQHPNFSHKWKESRTTIISNSTLCLSLILNALFLNQYLFVDRV